MLTITLAKSGAPVIEGSPAELIPGTAVEARFGNSGLIVRCAIDKIGKPFTRRIPSEYVDEEDARSFRADGRDMVIPAAATTTVVYAYPRGARRLDGRLAMTADAARGMGWQVRVDRAYAGLHPGISTEFRNSSARVRV